MPERPRGKGRRQLDKFSVERPTEEVSRQYLRHYNGKDLWFSPDQLPPLTSRSLFGNEKPLILDLGCGRGEYSIAMAELDQSSNCVGIDSHAKSLWDAVGKASEGNLPNIRFVRAEIRIVMRVIPDNSVSEIHIMFPPPVVVRKHTKKDFITPEFIGDLCRIMVPGANLHLATDHEKYFRLKEDLIKQTGLFDLESLMETFEGGLTRYQRIWEKHGYKTLRAVFKKK